MNAKEKKEVISDQNNKKKVDPNNKIQNPHKFLFVHGGPKGKGKKLIVT